jgi:hypothetical protein
MKLDLARLFRITWARALISAMGGVAVFLIAYLGLVAISRDPSVDSDQQFMAEALARAFPSDSLSPQIKPGYVAIAAPSLGGESLLAQTRVGDRLDILALLPSDRGKPPVAAVIVRGAPVLSRAASGPEGSTIVEVTPDEAIMLAHAVQSGIRINYTLWPSAGPPPPVPPLTLDEARALLGLSGPLD